MPNMSMSLVGTASSVIAIVNNTYNSTTIAGDASTIVVATSAIMTNSFVSKTMLRKFLGVGVDSEAAVRTWDWYATVGSLCVACLRRRRTICLSFFHLQAPAIPNNIL